MLIGVVEDLFTERLAVQGLAGPAVNEDEGWPQDKALALHVGAHRHDDAAAEGVVRFLFALDEAGSLLRREQHGAGHDQRLLIFLTDPLPVGDVRKNVLVGFEVFLVVEDRRLVGILRRRDDGLLIGNGPRLASASLRLRWGGACSADWFAMTWWLTAAIYIDCSRK